MSENIQTTQNHIEEIFDNVRLYIPGMAKRLAFNYLFLMGIGLLITITIVPVMARYIPVSTARALGFVFNLGWFVNGWRYLEKRNQATALFALYSRFSRTRRDAEKVLAGKSKTEEVTPLIEAVELTASAFIDAAEEARVEPYEASK